MDRTGSQAAVDPWSPATGSFRRFTAVGLAACVIPIAMIFLLRPDLRIGAVLAGLTFVMFGVLLLTSNVERLRRSVPNRRLGHQMIGLAFAIVFGLTAVGFFMMGATGQRLDWTVDDLPLLFGTVPAAIGLVRLCWPPGTTGREALLIVADGLVAAAALLVVWVLVVIPVDAHGDWLSLVGTWAQYLVIVAIVVVDAASRRPGSLPIQQLILLQSSVVAFVAAHVIEHLVGSQNVVDGWASLLVGTWIAVLFYRQAAQRPELEIETERMTRLRNMWSATVSTAVLIGMALVAVGYRYLVGPLPSEMVTIVVLAVLAGSLLTGLQRVILAQEAESIRMARVRTSLEANANSEWFSALVGQSHDVVTVVDRSGLIVFQTPSIEALFGYSPTHYPGRHVSEMFEDVSATQVNRWLQESMHTAEHEPMQLVLQDCVGDARETETVVIPLRADGSDGYVLTTRDVTDRLRLRAALAESDQRDALTGLTNRQGFLTRLRQLLPTAGNDLAVILIDIVGFRNVNDSRGHDVGDSLLRGVAAALDRLPPSVTVAARFGADEFALIVMSGHLEREVGYIDRLLREALTSLVADDGSILHVPFSMGYVTRQPGNDTAPDLIERADLALAAARSGSMQTAVKYERGMRSALVERLQQESDLREALADDRVIVHYQPIIEMQTGRLSSVEALVRLRDRNGSLIYPDLFIGHAEELGLIGQLGTRVLEQAVRDVQVLSHALGREISVAVNVSADQIDHQFPVVVEHCLMRNGASAAQLTIEVTESSIVRQAASARVLQELQQMGCAIAIDDFGTGYSSLSYLVGLPVDELKIDRSFVGQLASSARALSLVRVLLQMALTLGLDVVAEGVESVEQADLLRGMGCAHAQGYLYSRPVALPDLLESVAGLQDAVLWQPRRH